MTLTPKQQDKLIEEEAANLRSYFEDVSDDKRRVADRLIEQVAFMKMTLKILQDDIKERGPTYLFENGKQVMMVENPAQKSYNTMINRYTAAVDKLTNLLPKEEAQEVDDGFNGFIEKRG